MSEIRTRHLFNIDITVPEIQDVGRTPYGHRRVALVTGGTFEGERLSGKVLGGGGDWLLGRADGVLNLDVRLNLETDDGARIYIQYHGILELNEKIMAAIAKGEDTDYGDTYFMTQPRFETGHERYVWLNDIVAVAQGRFTPDGIAYEMFACMSD